MPRPPPPASTWSPVDADTAAPVAGPAERYEVGEPIGEGGSAEVRAAFDARLRREVAMKLLSRAGPGARDRFLAEGQVTAQLEHPNIVPVHDLGVAADGRAFLVMKRVRGESLAELLRRDPPSLARRLDVFRKVCDAVDFAHARGVLHRDLKPDNVMVGAFGEVVVMDWGLARPFGAAADEGLHVDRFEGSAFRTRDGQVAGTPAYMAPEQAQGRLDALDVRTDVYGLGALLWELLVGRPPLSGDVADVLRDAGAGRVEPPRHARASVPRELDAVVRRAMALRQEDRYPTVRALREDIDAWVERRPLVHERSSVGERLAKWGARNRAVVVAVTGMVGLAGLGTVGGLWRYAVDVQAARDRAVAESTRARAALLRSRIALSDALAAQGHLRDAQRPLAEAAAEPPDDARLALELSLARAWRAAQSPPPVARCHPHGDGQVRAIALSPDGARGLSWGEDGRLVAWAVLGCDVAWARHLAGAVGPGHLAWGPEGPRAAVVAGGALHLVDGADAPITTVALPPAVSGVGRDGDAVWVTDRDGAVWTVAGGVVSRDPWAPPDRATWRPALGGRLRLAESVRTGNERGGAWDDAGRSLWEGEGVNAIDVTPDGRRLLVGSSVALTAVDLASGAVAWRREGEPIQRLGIAPGGEVVWVAGFDGTVRAWDVAEGRRLAELVGAEEGQARAVATTPAARLLAVADGDGEVAVHLRPARGGGRLLGADAAMQGLALDPTGALVAVADDAGLVRVVDRATGVVLRRWTGFPSGARQVAFSADGRRLAVAARDEGLVLLDVVGGGVAWRTRLAARTVSVAWDGPERLATVDVDGWLTTVDPATGAATRVRRVLESASWDLTPMGSGELLAAGHLGATLDAVVFASADGAERARLPGDSAVFHHAASPDGRWIAMGRQDGEVVLWDRAGGPARRLHADDGPTIGVAFSPDGALLATTGFSQAVRLWDVATGERLRSYDVHDQPGLGVVFSPDGEALLSAAMGGLVSIPLRHAGDVDPAALSGPARARALATIGWWEGVEAALDATGDDEPALRARAHLAAGRVDEAVAVARRAGGEDPLLRILAAGPPP